MRQANCVTEAETDAAYCSHLSVWPFWQDPPVVLVVS